MNGALRESIDRLVDRRAAGAVIPPADVFRALALTPLAQPRVLSLGQSPYHDPGQTEGLAFSVPAGVPMPPSLRTIVAELGRDLGLPRPRRGSLRPWARRGVWLRDSPLLVEQGHAGSLAGCESRALTDKMVANPATDTRPQAFMLWGAHAQSKLRRLMDAATGHLLLQCNHPLPLSARRGAAWRGPVPFVGCAHFSPSSGHPAAVDPGASPLTGARRSHRPSAGRSDRGKR